MKRHVVILLCFMMLLPSVSFAQFLLLRFNQKQVEIWKEQGAYDIIDEGESLRHKPVYANVEIGTLLVALAQFNNDYDHTISINLIDKRNCSLNQIKKEIINSKDVEKSRQGNDLMYCVYRNVSFAFADGVQRTVKCRIFLTPLDNDILSIQIIDDERIPANQQLLSKLRESDLTSVRIGKQQWTFRNLHSSPTLKLMNYKSIPKKN